MPIKAIFASGQTEITVNGLHQWDYGQKLEIHSSDLPTVVEVHFACVGMDEAVVRSCTIVSGKATVSIPDICLEHTTPITAWVFEINGTAGTTTKKITLPIEPRTKPSKGGDIPIEVTNRYTEQLTAVNDAVGKLTKGEVKAKNAELADRAKQDANGNVISDTYATKASLTDGTLTVKKAEQDANGNVIHDTYATKAALTDGTVVVKEADHATTADKLRYPVGERHEYYPEGSNTITIRRYTGSALLVRIQPTEDTDDWSHETMIVYGYGKSTRSANGYYCTWKNAISSSGEDTNTLTFYGSSGGTISPYRVYVSTF